LGELQRSLQLIWSYVHRLQPPFDIETKTKEVQMPSIHPLTLPAGDQLFWNVDHRVGRGGQHVGIDVELVQYFLFRNRLGRAKPNPLLDPLFLDLSDVTGIWDPKSDAALRKFERLFAARVLADGCVDRMRPGQIVGSISHLAYKLVGLNIAFVRSVIGVDPVIAIQSGVISLDDFNDTILGLADQSDLPGRLRVALNTARALFQTASVTS
jgi:hypothetical protein